MPPIFRRLLTALVLVLGSVPAATSGVLYRWIDADGRAHFSDRPPPGEAGRAEQMEVPSYAAPELPIDQAPYSILNQLRRLEASREKLARELQQRQERRQRERELALRQRELELRERKQVPVGTPVYAYPRPPHGHPPPGHQRVWPVQPPRLPSLWQPDHPAYLPYPYPPPARTPSGVERHR